MMFKKINISVDEVIHELEKEHISRNFNEFKDNIEYLMYDFIDDILEDTISDDGLEDYTNNFKDFTEDICYEVLLITRNIYQRKLNKRRNYYELQ